MKEWTDGKLDRPLFEKWDLMGCSFCNCFSSIWKEMCCTVNVNLSFSLWVSAFSYRESFSWAHGLVAPELLTATSHQFKVIPFTGQCLLSKRPHLNETCSYLMWDLMHMRATTLRVKWSLLNMSPFASQEHFAFKCRLSFCTSTAPSALYCGHREGAWPQFETWNSRGSGPDWINLAGRGWERLQALWRDYASWQWWDSIWRTDKTSLSSPQMSPATRSYRGSNPSWGGGWRRDPPCRLSTAQFSLERTSRLPRPAFPWKRARLPHSAATGLVIRGLNGVCRDLHDVLWTLSSLHGWHSELWRSKGENCSVWCRPQGGANHRLWSSPAASRRTIFKLVSSNSKHV